MKERVSALMDDQLDDASRESCLEQLGKAADLRDDWALYHLIGDTLRGTAAHTLPAAFRERLAAEPTVLAPPRTRDHRPGGRSVRHYALSAAAGVAAVALVAWVALPQLQPAGSPPIASTAPLAPTAVSAAAPPREQPAVPAVPVARDMNDYLIAHQRFSPSSAMSGVAPYVRTVSETNRSR